MRVGNNVEMLYYESSGLTVHPTLIWDDDNLFLVDTGTPDMWGAIRKEIVKAGHDPKDITGLVLTHQDMDHKGCARDILREAPNAKIYAYKDEVPYINGSLKPQKYDNYWKRFKADTTEGKIAFDKLIQSFYDYRVDVDFPLENGASMKPMDDLIAIHTPGHTYGHMCVLVKNQGILIAGDELNTSGGELEGAEPPYTFDIDTAVKSLGVLLNYDIKKVVCFHTGLFEGDVNKAIKNLKERKK